MSTQYWSAEYVPATKSRDHRVKIRNRVSNGFFHRAYVGSVPNDGEIGIALMKQLKQIYTSPLLSMQILWYDANLKILFFQTNLQGEQDGRIDSGTTDSV